MADEAGEIKETDIVFECPYCQKSLAIDYRAAGLTIQCTDCGKTIEVPIPKGMELSDLDTSDEDQRAAAMQLREGLTSAQARIGLLEGMVEEMKAKAEKHEHALVDKAYRADKVLREIDIVRKAVDQIADSLVNMKQALERP